MRNVVKLLVKSIYDILGGRGGKQIKVRQIEISPFLYIAPETSDRIPA